MTNETRPSDCCWPHQRRSSNSNHRPLRPKICFTCRITWAVFRLHNRKVALGFLLFCFLLSVHLQPAPSRFSSVSTVARMSSRSLCNASDVVRPSLAISFV